jgi:cysteine desulfuration protein SufE
MPDSTARKNPFGTTITADDIIDTLGFFDSWDDRYKYIIDLGRELPAMDDSKKDDDHLVRGCQSQVWIDSWLENDRLWFEVDSDAFIVKGLLGVILAAYNGKTAADILAFDIDEYFQKLELIKHLSATRGNGLRAMVERIRATAGPLKAQESVGRG